MSIELVMICAYTVVLPVIVGTVSLWKGRLQGSTLVLYWVFCSSLFFEIQATVFRILYQNNIMVLNLAGVVEGLILFYFLRDILQLGQKKSHNQIYIVISSLLAVLFVLELLLSKAQFFNYMFTFKNLVVIIGLSLVIYRVSRGEHIAFWMYLAVGALLFYHTANFVFFAALSAESELTPLMWFLTKIHVFTNAATNIFFGITLWKLSTSKPLFSPSLY